LKTADSGRLHKHSGGQLTDVLKELHVLGKQRGIGTT